MFVSNVLGAIKGVIMDDKNYLEDEFKNLEEFEGEAKHESEPYEQPVLMDRLLWKIKKLEEEISKFEDKKQSSISFYDRCQEKLQNQIDYRGGILKQYMQHHGLKTEKFSNGTLSIRKRTKVNWENSTVDDLVEYSDLNEIPKKIDVKPNKSLIKKRMMETGEFPSGVEVEEVEDFNFKT
jgi:hypothetical protein